MKEDGWRFRRRFMIVTVAFCKAVIVYVLVSDLESASAETAVNMAFLIIGTTVSSYVFGAAWEDINKHKDMGRSALLRRPKKRSQEMEGDLDGNFD